MDKRMQQIGHEHQWDVVEGEWVCGICGSKHESEGTDDEWEEL